jgi:hypothetical protein
MRKPPKVRVLPHRTASFAEAYASCTVTIALILAMLPGASAASGQNRERPALDLSEWERIDKGDLSEDIQE